MFRVCSHDGVRINRLDADRLNDLYMAYGEHYKQMFILIAMDTLTDLVSLSETRNGE